STSSSRPTSATRSFRDTGLGWGCHGAPAGGHHVSPGCNRRRSFPSGSSSYLRPSESRKRRIRRGGLSGCTAVSFLVLVGLRQPPSELVVVARPRLEPLHLRAVLQGARGEHEDEPDDAGSSGPHDPLAGV